jgi:hypothetical protein
MVEEHDLSNKKSVCHVLVPPSPPVLDEFVWMKTPLP